MKANALMASPALSRCAAIPVPLLVVDGAQHVDGRMPAPSVVDGFEPLHGRRPCPSPCWPGRPLDQFELVGGEERLGQGVDAPMFCQATCSSRVSPSPATTDGARRSLKTSRAM